MRGPAALRLAAARRCVQIARPPPIGRTAATLGSTPLSELAARLSSGATTSRELVEQALAAIEAPDGEGSRVFVSCNADRARVEADASDALRKAGVVPSPLAGLPVSMKDLFDVAGEVTTAASPTLADEAPATRDSTVVARLRAAGAIVLGSTNLTEFAYSGIGINPHFGTPKNPWDRSLGRIPGGSSSGAAVSVTDGMAAAAIGSDTGGSVRIPAALCGVTGFKTTTGRIPWTACFRCRTRSTRRVPWRLRSPAAPCSTRRWRAATCGTRLRRCPSRDCGSVSRRPSSRTAWTTR